MVGLVFVSGAVLFRMRTPQCCRLGFTARPCVFGLGSTNMVPMSINMVSRLSGLLAFVMSPKDLLLNRNKKKNVTGKQRRVDFLIYPLKRLQELPEPIESRWDVFI